MFSEYVKKAMRQATYELIEDGTYFAEIPGFTGVWGNGKTVEDCREDLKDALEGWLLLGLWEGDESLPTVEGLSLIPKKAEAAKAKRKREAALSSRTRKAS